MSTDQSPGGFAGAVGNAMDGLSKLTGGLKKDGGVILPGGAEVDVPALTKLDVLTNATFWYRIGWFAGGLILVWWGVLILTANAVLSSPVANLIPAGKAGTVLKAMKK